MSNKKSKHILSFFNYSEQLEELKHKQNELLELQHKIANWKQKAKQIQSNFDFTLPNYIIDEIIKNENNKDYLNLYYLINCAVINGRISEENGKRLKQGYLLTSK